MNIYLVADVRSMVAWAPVPAAEPELRPLSTADMPELADLYLRAYDVEFMTVQDAVAEMESAFDGTWGAFWPEASPGLWIGCHLVAVVQTVRRPSMSDAPDCPWLIEVFTDPQYRRKGLGKAAVRASCQVLESAGEPQVGLTVDDDNRAALALYRSLGFSEAT